MSRPDNISQISQITEKGYGSLVYGMLLVILTIC